MVDGASSISGRAGRRPAEQDQLGIGGTGLAQQIEPRAVAIIDLGMPKPGDVDHLDIGIDQVTGTPCAISICATVWPKRP
jgi:hypothetical protein